jgi:hypothetical protein
MSQKNRDKTKVKKKKKSLTEKGERANKKSEIQKSEK